eukprot:7274097-Lingulodinium_polyedra.AAC.1
MLGALLSGFEARWPTTAWAGCGGTSASIWISPKRGLLAGASSVVGDVFPRFLRRCHVLHVHTN